MKLIVINSYGPMGASLLGGLVEKLGATNFPLRNLGLSGYLMGDYAINSRFMQERLRLTITSHSGLIKSGGVSMLDRDAQEARSLTDYKLVMEDIEEIQSRTFNSISDLYLACRNIYGKAITYKISKGNPNVHIEYPIDFGKFNASFRSLYDAYYENFEDVRMIYLHRDFEGWINSIVSQRFSKPNFSERIKFRLKSWVNKYYNYEKSISDLLGFHINFDELFSGDIELLAERVRAFSDMPPITCSLRNESYDLYGKTTTFEKAFNRFDDKQQFLDKSSQKYFAKFVSCPERIGFLVKLFAWFRYIVCYVKLRIRSMVTRK